MIRNIDGDRLVAFMMVNGKVYSSDCDHQDCLEQYYQDNGIKSEFDYSKDFDAVQAAAAKKTCALKDAHEVYGFDLFDDGDYYLLAHDKVTYDACNGWMRQYQEENSESDIKLGYFIKGYEAEIMEAAS